jgi:hypothetical protein
MTPMKTNSGTATSNSLTITPKVRDGRPPSRCHWKTPSRLPIAANASPAAASVRATG